MLTLLLESAIICVSFSLSSLVPPLMKTFAPFKAYSIPPLERPALPMALQRTTMSGANVLKKQSTWRLVDKCANSLLPSSKTAFLLIQGLCGTPFGKTSATISSAILSFVIGRQSQQRSRFRTMASTSSTSFLDRLESIFRIGIVCHRSQEIGAPSFRI